MPKNPGLEYEPQIPAFLRRLKAGEAELDGRHNVAILRARGMGRNSRLDMQGEDGEDDPLMLDENGNEISKEEMKELEKPKEEEKAKPQGEVVDNPEKKVDEKVSSGFGKKRKAVRVVGDAKDMDEEAEVNDAKSLETSTRDLKDVVVEGKEKAKKDTDAKKKRKKVKLSFDEPD